MPTPPLTPVSPEILAKAKAGLKKLCEQLDEKRANPFAGTPFDDPDIKRDARRLRKVFKLTAEEIATEFTKLGLACDGATVTKLLKQPRIKRSKGPRAASHA